MVSVALMAAIVVLLANTPLGMIQLPVIKATTVHIPVIIGAILLGPMAGAILGATFGVCSLISNTVSPTLLSFAFSPFLSTTGAVGGIKAIWISIGCRILIGVAAGWLWILLKNLKVPAPVGLAITGFVGSMVNTICVMGSIYFLFAQHPVFTVFYAVQFNVVETYPPELYHAVAQVFAHPSYLAVEPLVKYYAEPARRQDLYFAGKCDLTKYRNAGFHPLFEI